MLKKILSIFLLSLLFVSAAVAGTDINATEARADRFFHYREWISAGALYTMLLGERPADTKYCSRAIVSAGMLGDTLQQIRLTDLALDAHMPVDSLFKSVERTSFSVGQTSLYERYLLLTKLHSPWLTRVVDAYLMEYYAYRRDPAGMIAYSKIMLNGNPDDERFLYTLAQGYLLSGMTDEAVGVYHHIVQLNPRSVEAVLYLANYYNRTAESDAVAAAAALAYFGQAFEIRPTPYVADAIETLQKYAHSGIRSAQRP